MYLVPRKYGDWGLRKRPEKDRRCIKGLFFPRARLAKPTRKLDISFQNQKWKGIVGFIYMKDVVDSEIT